LLDPNHPKLLMRRHFELVPRRETGPRAAPKLDRRLLRATTSIRPFGASGTYATRAAHHGSILNRLAASSPSRLESHAPAVSVIKGAPTMASNRRTILATGVAAMAAASRVLAQQGGQGGAAMSFYEKGAVRIHFEETGSGFPLLLIPGGGLNSTISNFTRNSPFNP